MGKILGDENQESFYSHVKTENGGWAYAGMKTIGQQNMVYLVVTDADGEILIEETYGDDDVGIGGHALLQTEDGGYLIGGSCGLSQRGGRFGAMKIDSNGNVEWRRTYGNFEHSTCSAVLATGDNEYLLVGYSQSGDEGEQGYVVRVDGDGEIVWENIYGGNGSDYLIDGASTGDEFILVGQSLENRYYDVWLVIIDGAGETLLQRRYGEDRTDRGNAICRSPSDDGWIIAGQSGLWQDYHATLLKLNNEFEEQWFHVYENDEFEIILRDVIAVGSEAFAAVGYCFNRDGLAYSMVINGDGDREWERFDRVEEEGAAAFISVCLDDDFGIVMAGYANITHGESNLYDGWVMKLETSNQRPELHSRFPENSSINVHCGNSITFNVEAADPEQFELSYLWILQGDSIGGTDSLTLEFHDKGRLDLDVIISDGIWEVEENWEIEVLAFIDNWSPEDTNLVIKQNDSLLFELNQSIPTDTMLTFEWSVMYQIVGNTDSLSFTFNELGNFPVQCFIDGYARRETILWHVQVEEIDHVLEPDFLPETISISPAYPNPFNSTTTIEYALPYATEVALNVYNIRGQLVDELINAVLPAGRHSVVWDTESTATGVYFLEFSENSTTIIQKLILTK